MHVLIIISLLNAYVDRKIKWAIEAWWNSSQGYEIMKQIGPLKQFILLDSLHAIAFESWLYKVGLYENLDLEMISDFILD